MQVARPKSGSCSEDDLSTGTAQNSYGHLWVDGSCGGWYCMSVTFYLYVIHVNAFLIYGCVRVVVVVSTASYGESESLTGFYGSL